MRFLVSGASGFVGRALCAELQKRGLPFQSSSRSPAAAVSGVDHIVVNSIGRDTDWSEALSGMDVVIHLAARVHVMHEHAADPLSEFLEVNLHGTANLARQAARAGVKRLVYVSSVKVNGECTLSPGPSPMNGRGESKACSRHASATSLSPSLIHGGGKPDAGSAAGGRGQVFRESDAAHPQDPYAISKWEAEQVLHSIAEESGMEVVIVRPPLVYGPAVKANFARLIQIVNQGIPLPLSRVRNARSLIYVGNLVDALIVCATYPAAAGQTYLVSDGEDVSTPQLIDAVATALNKPARLFPVPIALMRAAAAVIGKAAAVDRLTQSLLIDSSKIRNELGWQPPYTLAQGLQATVEDFYRHAK